MTDPIERWKIVKTVGAIASPEADYEATRIAAQLLTGEIHATLILPHYSLASRLRGAWRAVKNDWNRTQHLIVRPY